MLKESVADTFMRKQVWPTITNRTAQATPPQNAAAIAVAREDLVAAGPLWKTRSGPLTEPGDTEPWRLPDEMDPRAAVYEAVTMPGTRRHVIKALRQRHGRFNAIKAAALRTLEQGVADGLCTHPLGRRDVLPVFCLSLILKLPGVLSALTDSGCAAWRHCR